MKRLFSRLNLVQKVTFIIIILFAITSISMALVISQVIRQSYLNEEKRTISQFVLKQAALYLSADDLAITNIEENRMKFDTFRGAISTSDVASVTVFSTEGRVLSSDDPTLIAKQLTPDALNWLGPVFGGAITTSINKPILESDLGKSKNNQLLRIYIPLIFDDINVVGVTEVAVQLTTLNSEIAQSQAYTLTVVTAIILIIFITLYVVIRQASLTLVRQDIQLKKDIENEQEYSKLKSEFITEISHQLRTPATTINWSLEKLSDPEAGLNSKQADAVNSAQTASQTLTSIVNNMLVVTDIKPDYFSFEEKSYLLEDLVREILDKNKKYLESKQHKLIFQNKASGAELNIKRSALSLVIESIYKNAIDYSQPDNTITVTLVPQSNAVQIEIIDNGIGIPESERDKIFGQFFRASNSIEQKNAGSGLSLYIAYKISTGYGGKLQYSPLEKGSKFTLLIPLTRTN